MIKDVLDREWQLATIQIDYILPKRLGLKYIDSQNQESTPVVIHRAIAGSVERFIGILIEQYQGAFPLWLCPIQVIILPITDKNSNYAQRIYSLLIKAKMRCGLDNRNETLQAKIRDATLQKIPYMVVVGQREEKAVKIAIRTRDGQDLGQMAPSEFVTRMQQDIATKT